MRFHTAINASRSAPPNLSIIQPPNPNYPAELHVSFGGLSVWLSETEATTLGQQMIEAGIWMRALAADVENTKED